MLPTPDPMSRAEQRTVAALASLYSLRMLGLFMVLPVMAIEGINLNGATATLLGLAMGAYGLTQALLQIPAGTLSDRIGRKPVIIGGLVIFALGSVICAVADNIWLMIIGRALQGAGAIASAIMALVTDLTREEHRMKAMASIGASIGLSFSVALILGPWLAELGGLPLMFGFIAVLTVAGILLTIFVVPTPPVKPNRDATPIWSEVWVQAKNPKLWPLNIGVFILHAMMVGIFLVVPNQLSALGLASASSHSWLYLPVLIAAFILMVPFIIIAEKKRQMKSVVISGAVMIACSLLMMAMANQLWHWVVALLIYFWGFNLMEASLPSWLSKEAPAGAKGSAMGIFSSLQFLGAFVGGAVGGVVVGHFSGSTLFVGLGALMILWALFLSRCPAPQYLTSVRLETKREFSPEQLSLLQAVPGVAEVNLAVSENAIYLKVNANAYDHEQALALMR